MNILKVLDLFSGLGGFSLGLERTKGFETISFCEIDPFCRQVLQKHWPAIPIFQDITSLKYQNGVLLDIKGVKEIPTKIDLICGGFPCAKIYLEQILKEQA